MSVTAKFSIKRAGQGLSQVLEKLLEVDGSYVKAGVIGGAKDARTDGMTNAHLALIHEFGAPSVNIPARPFVLPSFQKHRDEYMAALRKLLKDSIAEILKGGHPRTYKQALGIVGLKMAADMKAFIIRREVQPQLDPAGATYARKVHKGAWRGGTGTPTALIDTGRLVDSITHEVVTK